VVSFPDSRCLGTILESVRLFPNTSTCSTGKMIIVLYTAGLIHGLYHFLSRNRIVGRVNSLVDEGRDVLKLWWRVKDEGGLGGKVSQPATLLHI